MAAITAMERFWTEEPGSRPNRRKIRTRIGELHCSLCTGTIEQALGRLPGVEKVAVSLTHEQALIEFDPDRADPARLIQTLRDIGYTISDPTRLRSFEEEERDLVREARRFVAAVGLSLASLALIARTGSVWGLALVALVFATLTGLVFIVLRPGSRVIASAVATGFAALTLILFGLRAASALGGTTPWITALFAIILVFGVARHIQVMAFQAFRRGILNQHVLLEIGAFAGLAGGAIGLTIDQPGYPTASFFAVATMVCTYHIFSEWLSLIVKTRSSQAVKRLLDLQPELARVVRDGAEIEIPASEVRIGDLARIRPGERLPVDGTVIDGRSAIDQALVTGEPLPVEKAVGDAVVGGSINGTGTLLVRVTAIGEDSFLRRVIRQVEDARALKPGVLHLVDRILRVYTPTVLVIAIGALILWLVVPALVSGHPLVDRAVFAALTVLVMGYPCAMGISAPLSIVRGAGEAADRGILMRTGEAFQTFRQVNHVVFDKTGTLTEGKLVLQVIRPVGHHDEASLLGLVAAVEATSEHPLAKALVSAAFDRDLDLPAVAEFQAMPGKGITAWHHGAQLLVGSPAFLRESGIDLSPIEADIQTEQEAGCTVILAAEGAALVGLISLGDRLKPDARKAIDTLRSAGVNVIMLTGDNATAAKKIAAEAGIETVIAEVLPQDKAATIRDLQRNGKVAMVGDGINDAPALMQADVGIAMGNGTDIAIEAADIVIMRPELTLVPLARAISARSYRKMVQNVALAFCFNGIGIPLAATGLINPVWAMIAMAASVTLIFINSLHGHASIFLGAVGGVGASPTKST